MIWSHNNPVESGYYYVKNQDGLESFRFYDGSKWTGYMDGYMIGPKIPDPETCARVNAESVKDLNVIAMDQNIHYIPNGTLVDGIYHWQGTGIKYQMGEGFFAYDNMGGRYRFKKWTIQTAMEMMRLIQ